MPYNVIWCQSDVIWCQGIQSYDKSLAKSINYLSTKKKICLILLMQLNMLQFVTISNFNSDRLTLRRLLGKYVAIYRHFLSSEWITLQFILRVTLWFTWRVILGVRPQHVANKALACLNICLTSHLHVPKKSLKIPSHVLTMCLTCHEHISNMSLYPS